MLAYLNDLTDFDHENMLLELFFNNAPDPIRASGISWLSGVLKNTKPEEQDPKWKKCWNLWKNRMRTAEEKDPLKNSQEISSFLRWLSYCPVGFDSIFPLLCKTIKYLHDIFDVRQLIEFVAKFSDKYPFEAVSLLRDVIFLDKGSWWNPKEEDEEKILRSAINCGNSEAKQIAFEIINFRGERGDFRWKELLEV